MSRGHNKAKARRTWEESLPGLRRGGARRTSSADEVICHGARPGEPPGIEGVRANDAVAWVGSFPSSGGRSIT